METGSDVMGKKKERKNANWQLVHLNNNDVSHFTLETHMVWSG